MITLRQSTTEFDGINASPFCSKLELFLRYYQIPFSLKPALPMHGPYRKIPFIEYQGKTIGDSELIIQQLLIDYGIDTGLNEKQQSQGRAWQLMLEHHLYWVMVYCRWITDSGWAKLEPVFFGGLKWPLRTILATRTRKSVEKDLYAHGLGRFSLEQVLQEGEKDIAALSTHLATEPFICGDKFSYFDFFAYAIIRGINSRDMPTPLTDIIKAYPSLDDYLQRVKAKLESVPEFEDRKQ